MSHNNSHQALPPQHQRTMLQQQRGSQSVNSPKSPYQQLQSSPQSTPLGQYSVQHQAAYLQNKAGTPDMSAELNPTQLSSPVLNGNYHSMAGNSVGVDVSQMSQQHNMPQSYQAIHTQQLLQHTQQLLHAQQQQQIQQQQNSPATCQQPQQQNPQQRGIQQQQKPRYMKQQPQQQPKQILQHSKAPQQHSPQTNGQAMGDMDQDTSTDTAPKAIDNESGNTSETESKDSTSNASETQNLANTKEKTPMCLINELARFNKMHHQYTLVDEQGPAHKKTFYVKLKLGEEEYSASGESIKKAQHAGAAIALTATKYPHPPAKPRTMYPDHGDGHTDKTDGTITPTVELNALAMRRGEAAVYKSIEPQSPPYYSQPNMDFRGLYNQRYHQYMRAGRDPRYRGGGVLWPLRYYPRMSRAFYVSLRVGHREFIGDGPTRQAARHNAAIKALRILKNLPMNQESGEKKGEEVVVEEGQAAGEAKVDDSLKSEISLVHEIALRRNMTVHFEVIRETGPPHMKTFVTRCSVSEVHTEGEGNSKKSSKKTAAEMMLAELRALPPLTMNMVPRPKVKLTINKKKNRNLIKTELQQQKADPNYGVGINPISRLIQIMQAQKKKEPVYTLVTERGLPRRREFVVQVEVEDKTCTGSGPNKKLAKRCGAEAMLQLLGYTKPSPQPTKSAIKSPHTAGGDQGGDKKVTFVEGGSPGGDHKGKDSQQRVPGLLHLPSKASVAMANTNGASSPTPAVNLSSIMKPSLRPEIQLRELCKALDTQLEVDDFTKKRPGGTEHITRITVGSGHPAGLQAFHGSSASLESSRDQAALDALKVLVARVKDVTPAGDGPTVKKDIKAQPVSLSK